MHKILHSAVCLLYLLLLLVPVSIGIASYILPHTNSGYNNGSCLYMGNSFYLADSSTDKRISMPLYLSKNKSYAAYESILPSKIDDDYELFIYSENANLKVYVNDSLISTYSCSTKRSELLPDAWHFIKLNSSFASQKIRIEVNKTDFVKLPIRLTCLKSVYIGDKTAVIYRLAANNLIIILIAVFLIISGCIILIFSHFMINKGGRVYIGFSMFIIFAGLWIFFKSDIRQIYLSDLIFAQKMDFVCLVMMQPPLLYITCIIEKQKLRKTSAVLSVISMLLLPLILLLSKITSFTFIEYYLSVQVLFTIGLILIAFYVTYNYIKSKKKEGEQLFLSAGLISMLTGGSLDIFINRSFNFKGGLGSAIGIFIFALLGIIIFIMWVNEVGAKERHELVLNEDKNAFLADMSHAIRTPVSTILGLNTLIQRESSSAATIECSNDIENAGQTLISLLDDIMDFSKIGSGEIHIMPVQYRITSLLNDCSNMIAIRADAKGIKYSLINNPSIPDCLYGDEFRIRQIIMNLLTNGIKYTNKGKVTLKIDYENCNSDEIKLIITVSDTGIGIKNEDIPKLFTAYNRLDTINNANIEGTGLGLSITKHLAEKMNGSISVESTYGRGSSFKVIIPQTVTDSAPAGEILLTGKKRISDNALYNNRWFTAPNAKILIVDDIEMNIKVMCGLLKPSKINIDTSLSGKKCLEMITENKYDLIFMDHMMPEMDGIETLKRLKRISPNPNIHTPVIMLTANAQTGSKDFYLKNGFDEYLSKPVKEETLISILRKWLPSSLISNVTADINNVKAADDNINADIGNVKVADVNINADISNVKAADDNINADINNVKAADDNINSDINNVKAADDKNKLKIEKLSVILNTKSGISYCVNDIDFYLNVLSLFTAPDRYEALLKAYEQKDLESYRINSHSLKSTSLTIGADALSAMAKGLEKAAGEKDIDYINMHHDEVMAVYMKLMTEIGNIIKE